MKEIKLLFLFSLLLDSCTVRKTALYSEASLSRTVVFQNYSLQQEVSKDSLRYSNQVIDYDKFIAEKLLPVSPDHRTIVPAKSVSSLHVLKLAAKTLKKLKTDSVPTAAGGDDDKPIHPLAVTSLASGILTLILILTFNFFGFILSVGLFLTALITGIMVLAKIARHPDQYGGRGFAIAGIALALLYLLLLQGGLFIFLYMIAALTGFH